FGQQDPRVFFEPRALHRARDRERAAVVVVRDVRGEMQSERGDEPLFVAPKADARDRFDNALLVDRHQRTPIWMTVAAPSPAAASLVTSTVTRSLAKPVAAQCAPRK
ncbi:MAG: hypothetical protein ACK56I_22650, partial [bacterium]